ncbi:GTP-binding protein [Steccherinum ochraceum]|uniref:GTP-binding protein n=1 Tax=Steccherinum ochraceum TaxID=92696 RepID=A0A4R0RN86_9APHY|nr:GTP-binding protein [Steccherinum ochraceum]
MRAAFRNLIRTKSDDPKSGKPKDDPDSINILLLGDGNAGKTCLVERFCDHTYDPSMRITMFLEMDPPGLEEFMGYHPMIPDYMPWALGIMIVFQHEDSLANIKERWQPLIEQYATKGTCQILVRCKADDETGEQDALRKQAQEFALELGVKFMETSARDNTGVDEAFATLTRDIITTLLPIPVHTGWVPPPFPSPLSASHNARRFEEPLRSSIPSPVTPLTSPATTLTEEIAIEYKHLISPSVVAETPESSSSARSLQTPSPSPNKTADPEPTPFADQLITHTETKADVGELSRPTTVTSDDHTSTLSVLEPLAGSEPGTTVDLDNEDGNVSQDKEHDLKAKDAEIQQLQEKIRDLEKTVTDMALQHRKEVAHLHEQITGLAKEVTETKKNQSKELTDAKADLEKKTSELSSVVAENVQFKEGLLAMRALNERMLSPVPRPVSVVRGLASFRPKI